jgi:hypothetical protein
MFRLSLSWEDSSRHVENGELFVSLDKALNSGLTTEKSRRCTLENEALDAAPMGVAPCRHSPALARTGVLGDAYVGAWLKAHEKYDLRVRLPVGWLASLSPSVSLSATIASDSMIQKIFWSSLVVYQGKATAWSTYA